MLLVWSHVGGVAHACSSCVCGYVHAQAWTRACECQQTTLGGIPQARAMFDLGQHLSLAWYFGKQASLAGYWAPGTHLSISPPLGLQPHAIVLGSGNLSLLILCGCHTVVWSRSLPTSPLLPPSSTSPPTLQLGVLGFSGQRDRESLIVPPLGALIWVTSHCEFSMSIFKILFFFFFWEFHACIQQNMKAQGML